MFTGSFTAKDPALDGGAELLREHVVLFSNHRELHGKVRRQVRGGMLFARGRTVELTGREQLNQLRHVILWVRVAQACDRIAPLVIL